MKNPKLGKPRKVYENPYHHIYKISADFGGKVKQFYVSDYGERVGLVISRKNEVLLVSQYRLLIDSQSWEIPGGRVDAGETPRAAAIREGAEEAGVMCRGLKPLVYLHPGLDTFQNPTHVFHSSRFVESSAGSAHGDEISARRWFPISTCVEMIRRKKIKDSLTIASLLAFTVFCERQNGLNA